MNSKPWRKKALLWRTVARIVNGPDGSGMFNFTISPMGTSSPNTAPIPISLMSKVLPFSKPHDGEWIVILTASLNRGLRRTSLTSGPVAG